MTSILKTDEIQSQNGGAVVKMQTLKHPSASGNNLELASDGNVSITNTLSAGTIGSSVVFPTGMLTGIAHLAYENNGAGGSTATNANVIRPLNKEIFQYNCPTTITSNEITFDEAGKYILQGAGAAYAINRHIMRIYENTGSTLLFTGSTMKAHSSYGGSSQSWVTGDVVIASNEITAGSSERKFGFYHIAEVGRATIGMGEDEPNSTVEQFLQVYIYRVS